MGVGGRHGREGGFQGLGVGDVEFHERDGGGLVGFDAGDGGVALCGGAGSEEDVVGGEGGEQGADGETDAVVAARDEYGL